MVKRLTWIAVSVVALTSCSEPASSPLVDDEGRPIVGRIAFRDHSVNLTAGTLAEHPSELQELRVERVQARSLTADVTPELIAQEREVR